MSGRRVLAVAVSLAVLSIGAVALAAPAGEGPPEDRILPLDQYTTDKARQLAKDHGKALRDLNADIYHCMPWLETYKASIGFFRPKHIRQDDRYLSLRVFIEQDPSPQFAGLTVERRASAMLSRYVRPLLRKMARDEPLVRDGAVAGFTVILEWLKQGVSGKDDRPIHETIAIYIPKPEALDFLGSRMSIAELTQRVRIIGFDGETPLGTLHLDSWDDNFVATHHMAGYQLAEGVTCN